MPGEAVNLMLCYEHKVMGRNIVPYGTSLMTELDLMIALSEHTDCIVARKKIKPGELYIDIYKADLQNDDIKQQVGAVKPKKDECPWRLYLEGFRGHKYEELVIVTPIVVAMGGHEQSEQEKKAEAEAKAKKG